MKLRVLTCEKSRKMCGRDTCEFPQATVPDSYSKFRGKNFKKIRVNICDKSAMLCGRDTCEIPRANLFESFFVNKKTI